MSRAVLRILADRRRFKADVQCFSASALAGLRVQKLIEFLGFLPFGNLDLRRELRSLKTMKGMRRTALAGGMFVVGVYWPCSLDAGRPIG